jgi:23S rRNA (uracil1939-C5)-methyltransferase
MPIADIESLDHEGRGVAHVDGKAVFIEGALPGEQVAYSSYRRKRSYEKAHAQHVLLASSQRVAPPCPHYGTCGGCSMQHLNLPGQTAAKQRVLEDALWHIARLKPEQIYPPITGAGWAYRLRARLSVRHVASKGGALIGFREKQSSYVALMDSCAVLPAHVSALIPVLKTLVEGMSQPDRMPQIEVAVGGARTVLLLRHLESLTAEDLDRLRRFADEHGIIWYLQPKGLDTVSLFHPPDAGMLSYELPDFGLELRIPADRISPRSTMRSTACSGAPGHGAARSAAGRADRRPVLRPGQFHAADCAPVRALSVSGWKAIGRSSSAGVKPPFANGLADR